jgi:hypothetical protein
MTEQLISPPARPHPELARPVQADEMTLHYSNTESRSESGNDLSGGVG